MSWEAELLLHFSSITHYNLASELEKKLLKEAQNFNRLIPPRFLFPMVLSGFMAGQGGMRMTWQAGSEATGSGPGGGAGVVLHREAGDESCHSPSADHSREPEPFASSTKIPQHLGGVCPRRRFRPGSCTLDQYWVSKLWLWGGDRDL